MSQPAAAAGTSLSQRLLLLGALPAIVVFVALMLFFTSARLDDARAEIAQNSQLLADSLAPALEYPVVAGNTQALKQILAESLKRSQASWIRVTNVSEDVLGFVGNNLQPSGVDTADFVVYHAEVLQEPLEIGTDGSVDWFSGQWGRSSGALRVGRIEVGVDPSLLQARQDDILWSSLSVGIVLLLLTLVLVNHFLCNILRPVRDLSGRVGRLIDGDYRRLPVGAKGATQEVAAIHRQLNDLALHLEELKVARGQTLALSETAREKAEHASNAKSEFLVTMGHELKTPLNGVLGMAGRIAEEPLSQKQQNNLITAQQSVRDLLMVISDMLDYARVEDSSLVLDRREFDVKALITNCVSSYRYQAEQQGLSLDLRFIGEWPEQPRVMADAPRLRQILAGLIDNALKLTSDGFINVHADWRAIDAGSVALSCTVADSGNGLATDQLHAELNSLEQSEAADSRFNSHAGLSLALVQRLIELQGGHIQIDTGSVQGNAFRFELTLNYVGEHSGQNGQSEPTGDNTLSQTRR